MVQILGALLLVAAARDKEHPLNLVVPSPAEAVRLAHYKTTPDETVLAKVAHLEKVTRAANTNAPQWAILLTPTAASISIKGWEEMDAPLSPLPEATLGECLRWLCRRAPELRFEVLGNRILMETDKENHGHNQASQAIGAGAPQPER